MTKQSSEIFLSYLNELAKEAGIPNNMPFQKFNLLVTVQHGKIFEYEINGSSVKIRPK